MAYTQISAVVPVLKKGVHIMTSDFGKRTITINGKTSTSQHKGVDLIGKNNSTDYIIAAAAGTVTIARYSTSAGNYVQINHGNGVYTRYLHMKSLPSVKVGQVVKKGQVLGYMGSTGQSTGAHLHFDVSVNGSYVDPKPYLSGVKSLVSTQSASKKPDVIYQVYADGKWWGEIKNYNNINSNGYAGVIGKEISGIRVKLSNGKKTTVRSHISGKAKNNWLSAITKWNNTSDGYSGWKGKATDCIAMKADGHTLKYRVHVKGGEWLGWISKYDINNYDNGLAGIYGKPIDAIQIMVV